MQLFLAVILVRRCGTASFNRLWVTQHKRLCDTQNQILYIAFVACPCAVRYVGMPSQQTCSRPGIQYVGLHNDIVKRLA